MKNQILQAKHILIIIPQRFCLDMVAAALALSKIIINNSKIKNRSVTLGSSNQIPKEYRNVLDFDNIQVINEVVKKEVVLSVNVGQGEVDAVRWRERDKKVQFIITPKEGGFEYRDVDIESVGGEYDLIVTLGCTNLVEIGTLYNKNKEAFEGNKIINLGIIPPEKSFANKDIIKDEMSLSSCVLEMSEEENLDIDREALEILFKGIFWANEGFRSNGGLKKAIEKMTSTKGNLSEVITQMYNSLSIAELRYMGKIISNLKIDSNGILISKISSSEIQGVNINRIIFPEINVLSRVKEYKVAVLLSEFEKDRIMVRIYSENVNVFEKYSDYSPFGNSRRISFTVEGNLQQVEKELLEKLSSNEDSTDKQIQPEKTVRIEKSKDKGKKKTQKPSKSKKEDKQDPLPKATGLPKAIEAPPITPIPPSQPFPAPQTYSSPPIYPQNPSNTQTPF